MSVYGTTCDLANAEAKRIVGQFWKECRESGLQGPDILDTLQQAVDELALREFEHPFPKAER